MTDRTWCAECERWIGDGVEHADSCSLEGGEETPHTLDEYSEDDLVAALDSIDEIVSVDCEFWNGTGQFRVTVQTDHSVESSTPITQAIRTFDLRLWYVDWQFLPAFTLVPAEGFRHDYTEVDTT